MKAKKIVAICAGVAAVLAIVIGLCCFFLATKTIREIPSFLKIEQVDDDYFLVTEYGGELKYQFKLEQKIDEEYIHLKTVQSDENALNLSTCGIDIIAGAKYRFSVCYCNENVSGEYSDEVLEWQPSWILQSVNYSSVTNQNSLLDWDDVYQADSYFLKFVKEDGTTFSQTVLESSFYLSNVGRGNYKVYIVANSANSYISSSMAGVGIDLTIEKTNEILSATLSNNKTLSVKCTEEVENFEVYVNGFLKGTLAVKNRTQDETGFLYVLNDAKIILSNVDIDEMRIEVKSCGGEFLRESEMREVVKEI